MTEPVPHVEHTKEELLQIYRLGMECPDIWAQTFLGVRPWARQREIMRAVAKHRRVSVRSGHGVGKSTTAASLATWFTMMHNPSMVITTAPTQRQVQQILWREMRKVIKRSGYLAHLSDKNHLFTTEWRVSDDQLAVGLTTNEADRFSGMHCANQFVIVDEAAGVKPELYEAIDSLLTSENTYLLLLSNPTVPEGYFYESQMPGSGFHAMHVSSLESPNVTANADIIPGLVTAKWIAERKQAWGEHNPIYRARVLGEFPDSMSNALIPLSIMQSAEEVKMSLKDEHGRQAIGYLGCDVARFGHDATVICVRRGNAVIHTEEWQGRDAVEIAGRVAEVAKRMSVFAKNIYIDDTGVGGGVTDTLRANGHEVQAVVAGAAASDPDLYANVRAEMWCNLAHALEVGELSAWGQYKDDTTRMGMPERMRADLVAQTYKFTPKGQRQLHSKEEIRTRLGRSPDYGDALALTYAQGKTIENFVF